METNSLSGHFGLSYASWLTLPRLLMGAMPPEWQERMVELLDELDAAFPKAPHFETRVELVKPCPHCNGMGADDDGEDCEHCGKDGMVPDTALLWLTNYRRPNPERIEAMRGQRPSPVYMDPKEAARRANAGARALFEGLGFAFIGVDLTQPAHGSEDAEQMLDAEESPGGCAMLGPDRQPAPAPLQAATGARGEADAMLSAMIGECSMCGNGPGCGKDCDGYDHWIPKHDASPESLELLKALRLADKGKLASALRAAQAPRLTPEQVEAVKTAHANLLAHACPNDEDVAERLEREFPGVFGKEG